LGIGGGTIGYLIGGSKSITSGIIAGSALGFAFGTSWAMLCKATLQEMAHAISYAASTYLLENSPHGWDAIVRPDWSTIGRAAFDGFSFGVASATFGPFLFSPDRKKLFEGLKDSNDNLIPEYCINEFIGKLSIVVISSITEDTVKYATGTYKSWDIWLTSLICNGIKAAVFVAGSEGILRITGANNLKNKRY
jgi:hypothetical protein